jgi:hypothetical protein
MRGIWYILNVWLSCDSGIFFVLPCIDTYTKVDLRTVTFDVPPQEVSTWLALMFKRYTTILFIHRSNINCYMNLLYSREVHSTRKIRQPGYNYIYPQLTSSFINLLSINIIDNLIVEPNEFPFSHCGCNIQVNVRFKFAILWTISANNNLSVANSKCQLYFYMFFMFP